MDFDLDLAVKNSNENPIYYIEYANARISSILRGKEISKDSCKGIWFMLSLFGQSMPVMLSMNRRSEKWEC